MTVVASSRILLAPSSRQLLRVLQLVKDSAVSARRLSLGATIIPLSISLGNCWMGCLNLAGSEGQRSSLQKLNSTPLCVSSDRWKQAAINLVLRSTVFFHFAISPVSVLGGICTRLVFLCFKIFSIVS